MNPYRASWLVALLTQLPCQETRRTDRSQEVAAALANLQAELDPRAAGKLRLPSTRQRDLIEAFLAQHGDSQAEPVQTARCMLGDLLLHHLAPLAARAEFETVLKHTQPDRRDLRGRALYGIGQSFELTDESRAAREAFNRLIREQPGTRYAELGKAGLTRLETGRHSPTPGTRAPSIATMLDLQQRAIDLSTLHGIPRAVLFWSPESESSVDTLVRMHREWLQHGLAKEAFVTFVLSDDAERVRQCLKQSRLDVCSILCIRQGLEPVVLDYRVTTLPATFLIGADGKVILKDPSPTEWREVLRELTK